MFPRVLPGIILFAGTRGGPFGAAITSRLSNDNSKRTAGWAWTKKTNAIFHREEREREGRRGNEWGRKGQGMGYRAVCQAGLPHIHVCMHSALLFLRDAHSSSNSVVLFVVLLFTHVSATIFFFSHIHFYSNTLPSRSRFTTTKNSGRYPFL